MEHKWKMRMLSGAIWYSAFSKDPSTKVGCVLVNDLNTPVGWGCNGFSRHSSDDPELFSNREEKYKRVIHSEENAIFNAVGEVRGTTAFLTHPPCLRCCNILSQNGIKKVVFIAPSDDFNSRWNLDEITDELLMLGVETESFTMTEISDNLFADALIQQEKLRG